MDYSRKYPPPPPPAIDDTELGTQKFQNFQERQQQVNAGFQTPVIQILGEFQNFARFSMVFREFRSKFTKFWGNSWNSGHAHRAFCYRISDVVHGGCGYFLEWPNTSSIVITYDTSVFKAE